MYNEHDDMLFDEEYFGLEEGFLSKRRDKKIDKKIGKKEEQIEKIKQDIETAKERDTEVSREFVIQGEEKIDRLMKEIEELKEKMAERQVVAQEAFFDYDEELEELQEALNEKYEELELTVDYLEEGIKNGIVVAKEKFKGKIDAFKQKKLAKKIAKKQEQLDKAENEEKIEKLTKEIEELKAKLNVAQESFFVDDNDVEAIEESIKEKISQLNNSYKQKMKDLAAKKYKKVSSINQAINAAEAQNEYFGKLIQGREELGENKVEKLIRKCAWHGSGGYAAVLFGDGVKPTKQLKNAIRMNNMWMTALNKRREQLEAKNGGSQEEAPAQESWVELENLINEAQEIKEKMEILNESFYCDDSEYESLEESLKEKIAEIDNNVINKIKDFAVKKYKTAAALQAAIEKEEAFVVKCDELLNERNEEGKMKKVARILVQSALIGSKGNILGTSIVLMPKHFHKVSPNWVIKRAKKVSTVFINKCKEKLASMEEAPAQESFYDIEFFDED